VRRLLTLSAILTLIALALMVWSMLDPTPVPVMIAMTGAQGFGTLAFGLYVFAIVKDLRASYRRVEQEKQDKQEKQDVANGPAS
jgi:purine-cytosine permease-like protein